MREFEVIAAVAIDALVTQLTFDHVIYVAAALALFDAIAIIAVTVIIGMRDKIAVLTVASVISIVGVFIHQKLGEQARLRDS